jgi:uncharacterized protein (TIGR03435 family)
MVMRSFDFNPVLPGGQYVDSRAILLFMIGFAYDVKNLSVQLVGLPEWAKEASYSVSAKPAEGFPALSPAENREQVRVMLRDMLEDRFRLRVHTEIRQEAVLQLEVAKGGIKMKEVPAPVPPEKEVPVGAAFGNEGGRMVGSKSTMAGMVQALAIMLKRPVIDRTGLTGHYDFNVRWRAEDPAAATPGMGADGSALLISNLPDMLGLRLTKTSGPVTYWIVDHIERPTAN